jgi:hypothetical protein
MQNTAPDPFKPDSRTKRRLDYRLLCGFIVTKIFVYFLVGLSIYNSRLLYVKQAEIQTQNMAKFLESHIFGIFDKIDIGLFAVVREAERLEAAGASGRKDMNSYIQRQITQLPELYGLRIADAEGGLLYGTDIPAGKPVSVSDRDYFKRLRENPQEGLVISKAIRGRISGKWNITLARRINRPNGSFAGIALAMFEVGYFEKLFSQLDVGKHGAIGVRDKELSLVALIPKSKEPGSQIGSKVISKKTEEMIQANPEAATYKTVFARDNKERIVTFRKVAKYPFYVFATLSPSDYLAPWRRETAIALALVAIFTLATFSAFRLLVRSKTAELAQSAAELYGEEMQLQNQELTAAMSRIKRLEGIISICSYCKKIRTEQESWAKLETYLSENTDAMFSHGACPECAEEQIRNFKLSKARTSPDTV